MSEDGVTSECLGGRLPERWWRSKDPCPCGTDHLIIQHEREAHGSNAAAARTHGVNPQTVSASWSVGHGLPKLNTGVPAAKHATVDAVPGDPVDETETLKARVRELESHLKKVREGEVAEERVVQRLEAAIEKGDLVRTSFT